MKKILLTTTIIVSLLTMTACSSGNKNASKGSNKTVSFNKNGAGGNNADLPSSKNLEVRSDDAGNKINKEKKTEAVKVLSNGKVYEVKLETIKPKSGKKIARNPLKFTFKKKKRNPLKVIPTFNTENKEAKARAVLVRDRVEYKSLNENRGFIATKPSTKKNSLSVIKEEPLEDSINKSVKSKIDSTSATPLNQNKVYFDTDSLKSTPFNFKFDSLSSIDTSTVLLATSNINKLEKLIEQKSKNLDSNSMSKSDIQKMLQDSHKQDTKSAPKPSAKKNSLSVIKEESLEDSINKSDQESSLKIKEFEGEGSFFDTVRKSSTNLEDNKSVKNKIDSTSTTPLNQNKVYSDTDSLKSTPFNFKFDSLSSISKNLDSNSMSKSDIQKMLQDSHKQDTKSAPGKIAGISNDSLSNIDFKSHDIKFVNGLEVSDKLESDATSVKSATGRISDKYNSAKIIDRLKKRNIEQKNKTKLLIERFESVSKQLNKKRKGKISIPNDVDSDIDFKSHDIKFVSDSTKSLLVMSDILNNDSLFNIDIKFVEDSFTNSDYNCNIISRNSEEINANKGLTHNKIDNISLKAYSSDTSLEGDLFGDNTKGEAKKMTKEGYLKNRNIVSQIPDNELEPEEVLGLNHSMPQPVELNVLKSTLQLVEPKVKPKSVEDDTKVVLKSIPRQVELKVLKSMPQPVEPKVKPKPVEDDTKVALKSIPRQVELKKVTKKEYLEDRNIVSEIPDNDLEPEEALDSAPKPLEASTLEMDEDQKVNLKKNKKRILTYKKTTDTPRGIARKLGAFKQGRSYYDTEGHKNNYSKLRKTFLSPYKDKKQQHKENNWFSNLAKKFGLGGARDGK